MDVIQGPALAQIGRCSACGDEIGWVRLRPHGRRRPVDPTTHRHGEYALLSDGVHAIDLRRDPNVPAHLDAAHDGPRFWDHAKTCRVPGGHTLSGAATRAIRGGGGGDNRRRQAARRQILDADRRRDRGIDT